MSIFVIFRTSDREKLENAIKAIFPDNYLDLANGEWLVSGTLTAKEVSDKLGISSGENGSAIVFKMEAYFGRATNEVWDWVKTKSEATA